MSKRYKRLMAAADAAGYVLAAPDDPTPANPQLHLEAEFRNGHHQAAVKASAVASRAVAKMTPARVSPSRALATPRTSSTTSWLSAITHLRPKGLAA